jgi:hypothetical protein
MTITMARKTLSVLGVVYLLIGVLGFIPALVVATPVAGQGLLLGIFAVNTIHNLAHLVLGALMLYAGSSAARFWVLSRTLAGVFAFLVVGSVIAPIAEGVAINLADTGLHLVSALAIGYLAYASKPDMADQPVAA